MSLRYASLADVPAHLLPGHRAPVAAVEQPKRAKYGNEPVVLDGHKFDSKFQAKRYGELKNMQAAGLIDDLRLEPSYALHVNGIRIGAIEPDFTFMRSGELVAEDTKTKVTKTPLYEWKRRHLEIEYGISIVEIERNKRRRV